MKELKSLSMSFRVSPRFKECLARVSKEEGRSQANFLERLVFDYCDKHSIAPKAAKPPRGGAQ